MRISSGVAANIDIGVLLFGDYIGITKRIFDMANRSKLCCSYKSDI